MRAPWRGSSSGLGGMISGLCKMPLRITVECLLTCFSVKLHILLMVKPVFPTLGREVGVQNG